MSQIQIPSTVNRLENYLQSPDEFIQLSNDYLANSNGSAQLVDQYISILSKANDVHVHRSILMFIIDSTINQASHLLPHISDVQFKQDLIPFIRRSLINLNDTDELLIKVLQWIISLLEYRSDLFKSTLTEWLPCILQFIVTRLSNETYLIYGENVIRMLEKIVEHFTPLPKEIVDVLGRSPSSIISSAFLSQLKLWIKNLDDIQLGLYAIRLWQPLAALLSRLLTRGYTKGNEMLAVIQDAFIVANYSIRSAAFTAWSSFISHIFQSDDDHQHQLSSRLLKLFLTPFLPDNTSKSKSASIAKCRAWLVLLSAYPSHIQDVLLPYFSFAFGYFQANKISAIHLTWWSECRQMGIDYLHQCFNEPERSLNMIKTIPDAILPFIFDSIYDGIQEHSTSYLSTWKTYLTIEMDLISSMSDEQRSNINASFHKRFEQFWLDQHLSTSSLLKLFNTFEEIQYPLAIETIENPRTSLATLFLHLFIEHSIRYDPDDPKLEENYLRLLSHFIECLSKISDEYFYQQVSSLLKKCSLSSHSSLFWHCWSRCSTHLISILHRTRLIDFNQQQHDTLIDVLIQPLSFPNYSRLDHHHASIWTQVFKALCRLIVLDHQQSTEALLQIYVQFLRHTPAFQMKRDDSRLFGFTLVMVKVLIKEFSSVIDRTNSLSKRSLTLVTQCLTQLATILNDFLARLIVDNADEMPWLEMSACLTPKSSKMQREDQSRSHFLNSIRELLIDLFEFAQNSAHVEKFFHCLTNLIRFIEIYESSLDTSLLMKILSMIQTHFDASLLTLLVPFFIHTFQHPKATVQIRARKCWNATFGRLTSLVYPDELRKFLIDFKDKNEFLLPCFLVDQDESQLSQSIDIVTPLVQPSPVKTDVALLPSAPIAKPSSPDQSPVVTINERSAPSSNALTENQKEKFRTREPIPILCDDDETNSMSNLDTPTIESMMATYQLPPMKSDTSSTQEEDIAEESSIGKKLRRSRRPSTSARKSLVNNARKKRLLPTPDSTILSENSSLTLTNDSIVVQPKKSILKRLSPNQPRLSHTRRVAFHDQVKVLLFASPSRRNSSKLNDDETKKKTTNVNRDELRTSSIVTRRTSKLFNLTEPTTSVISPSKTSSSSTTEKKPIEPIYPSLINCDKPIDSLIHVLYGGVCPNNAINYFRSIQKKTVGDLARSSAEQIEVYPIPPPKLPNILKAFSLYEERLVTSPSLSPIIGTTTSRESLPPIVSSTEETMMISDGTFIKESSAFPSNPLHPMYDVDTLIDSLDYEQLYLNDDQSIPRSATDEEFLRERRQKALANRDEYFSPQKRRLMSIEETESNENEETKTEVSITSMSLGEHLRRAVDLIESQGELPFDDNYIELVRQLFNNPSLTHLQQLHLKSLFTDQ